MFSSYSQDNSKWAVVLCDMCGSSGTHIHCHPEVNSTSSYFVCPQCITNIGGEEGAYDLAKKMGIIEGPVASSSTNMVVACEAATTSMRKSKRGVTNDISSPVKKERRLRQTTLTTRTTPYARTTATTSGGRSPDRRHQRRSRRTCVKTKGVWALGVLFGDMESRIYDTCLSYRFVLKCRIYYNIKTLAIYFF